MSLLLWSQKDSLGDCLRASQFGEGLLGNADISFGLFLLVCPRVIDPLSWNDLCYLWFVNATWKQNRTKDIIWQMINTNNKRTEDLLHPHSYCWNISLELLKWINWCFALQTYLHLACFSFQPQTIYGYGWWGKKFLVGWDCNSISEVIVFASVKLLELENELATLHLLRSVLSVCFGTGPSLTQSNIFWDECTCMPCLFLFRVRKRVTFSVLSFFQFFKDTFMKI